MLTGLIKTRVGRPRNSEVKRNRAADLIDLHATGDPHRIWRDKSAALKAPLCGGPGPCSSDVDAVGGRIAQRAHLQGSVDRG